MKLLYFLIFLFSSLCNSQEHSVNDTIRNCDESSKFYKEHYDKLNDLYVKMLTSQ